MTSRVLLAALLLLLARPSFGKSICQNDDHLQPDQELFMQCLRLDRKDKGEVAGNSIGCNGECRQVETEGQCIALISRVADANFASWEPFYCGDLEDTCEEDDGLDSWMLKCRAGVKKMCCGGRALSKECGIFKEGCPSQEGGSASSPSSQSPGTNNTTVVGAVGGAVGGLLMIGMFVYCCCSSSKSSAAAAQPAPPRVPLAQPALRRNDSTASHAAHPASPNRPAVPFAQPPSPAYHSPPRIHCWAGPPAEMPAPQPQADTSSAPSAPRPAAPAPVQSSSSIDRDACVVCLDQKAVMAFMPCGHRCVCEGCAPALSECPMCRSPKQSVVRIYT